MRATRRGRGAGQRLRVLLADADPLARSAVRDALLREPALQVVGEAADGPEAVRLAAAERPDIVLIDAELTGSSASEEVRSILRAAPASAVIVISVVADSEVGIDSLYAGAAGYLDKITDPGALPRVVRAVAAGEAAISRELTMRLIERLRSVPPTGQGLRPVTSLLTTREWEVIDLLRSHANENAIAGQLGITHAAVRRHTRTLLNKLGASSVEEGIEFARDLCIEAVRGPGAAGGGKQRP